MLQTRTETLAQLRYTATQLVDFPGSAVREIGRQLVAQIDAEIARPVPAAPIAAPDLTAVRLDALLGEIARRVRIARRIPKLCAKCGKNRMRAKGLCVQCCQRARKTGAHAVRPRLLFGAK